MGETLYTCCDCDWYGTKPGRIYLQLGYGLKETILCCPKCTGDVKDMYEDEPTTLWECPTCKWFGSDPELAILYLHLPNERVSNRCPLCDTEVNTVRLHDSAR